jgi:hypothetical protein
MMKPAPYETVRLTEESVGGTGTEGKELYRIPRTIQLVILAVGTYGFAALGLTIYILRCAKVGSAYRVLPTGNMKVEQFYSGLALSFILAPAAILIRRLASDLAVLHPFALASKMPIEIGDLDLLADPGLWALFPLFRYSMIRGFIQAFVMAAGAFLVPVGTLLLFTGTYSRATPHIKSVGLPTAYNNMMIMSIEMNRHGTDKQGPTFESIDFFLQDVTNLFVGGILQQTGVLEKVGPRLGPVATTNLTYEEGVRYEGVVAFEWTSGCRETEDITYVEQTEQYAWMWNITLPDGSMCHQDAWESALCLTNVTDVANTTTTYYAIVGVNEETVNLGAESINDTNSGITFENGSWISRVACTPTWKWEVSSCLFSNGLMTDCFATPGANTTELDDDGLNAMHYYFAGVPVSLSIAGSYTYGLKTVQTALMFDPQATDNHQYRAPLISDYDKMYGLVAQSLATVASAGYYGVAEVPAVGSKPKPVYLVRTYILAIVVTILVLTPLLATALMFYTLFVLHAPLRRTTFLTISNAVRGAWWDLALWGTCLMSPSDARHAFRGIKVMFGATVDVDINGQIGNPSQHVGLALHVAPVHHDRRYFGNKLKDE